MKTSLIAGVSAALASQALACTPKQADYDVVIVGAGVIGCCTARELARYNLKALVLEAGLDIANGATRANSGIVHVGFDPTPGTLKAKYNVAGAALFPQWQEELGFNYQQNGALVLAFDDADLQTLETLKEQGEQNGASETRIIDQAELRKLEPNVSQEAVGALYAPESGIVDPYGFAFAAAENAASNGVEFLFGRKVTGVGKDGELFSVTTEDGTTVLARTVLNAAGVFSDEVNNMICPDKLQITVRRGEYQLYHNKLHPFTCAMFQTPTSKGKGVLITHAAFGNLIVGPNSVEQESKTSVATTAEGLGEIVATAAKTWPGISNDDVISNFAGLRAKNAGTGDFVIGESSVSGFFNAACIDSPGLASAPAIAQDLAQQIASKLNASENESFNPTRSSNPPFAYADEELQEQLLEQDPAYATTVCRCCQVREAEVTAVLNGSLGVYTLDAIKWRTGAMMGPCQGSRCMAKLVEQMADALGIKATEVKKRNEGSSIATAHIEQSCTEHVPGSAQAIEFDESVIELPRAHYRIPGTRPAGVYSARCVIQLLALNALPGYNAVVWGNKAEAKKAIPLMRQAGVTVTQLADDDTITCISGDARLESITVAHSNGSQEELACDTLVISHDHGKAEG